MVSAVTIEVDSRQAVGKINRLDYLTRAYVKATMVDIVDLLADRVRQKLSGEVLQVRTGALLESIHGDVSGDGYSGEVYSDGSVPYAAIQEYGGTTAPHDIYPVNALALAFEMGGELRFFAHVHHPGSVIPERSYLRSSLDEMQDQIVDALHQAVINAADEAA